MIAAPLDPYWKIKIWNDLFALQFKEDGSTLSVIDAIVRSYNEGEKIALNQAKSDLFPTGWASALEWIEEDQGKKRLKVIIR